METKEQVLQGVDKMLQASEENLSRYNDGYREGFSDGWDNALEEAKEVVKKYNLGQEKDEPELLPAVRFLGQPIKKLYAKVYEELDEAAQAFDDGERLERKVEEIVDIQLACETLLAKYGLNAEQRRAARRKKIDFNRKRGYYKEVRK